MRDAWRLTGGPPLRTAVATPSRTLPHQGDGLVGSAARTMNGDGTLYRLPGIRSGTGSPARARLRCSYNSRSVARGDTKPVGNPVAVSQIHCHSATARR